MTVVQTAVDIDAPPDRVWKIVSDPRNLTRWDRRITSVEGVPEGGLREGSTYTTNLRYMGARAKVDAKVLELQPESYAKVRLTGILDATVETWVQPIESQRTRLTQKVDYRFGRGRLARLASSAVKMLGASRQLRQGVVAQKRQAEEESRA